MNKFNRVRMISFLIAAIAGFSLVMWAYQAKPLTIEFAASQKVADLQPAPPPNPFLQLLDRAYYQAVEDAADATASEIANNLVAIDPSQTEVTVVSWMDGTTAEKYYQPYLGTTTSLGRSIWVTVVPQLQKFCQELNYQSADLTLRLEQYLGLPFNNGKTKFVEIVANPAAMFRPCPDPEISDSSCGLEYPNNVSAEHKTWFENQVKSSYDETAGGKAYPWTRLGYTYDWGNTQKGAIAKTIVGQNVNAAMVKEVGASEFILKKNASVIIKSIQNTQDYCRPAVDRPSNS